MDSSPPLRAEDRERIERLLPFIEALAVYGSERPFGEVHAPVRREPDGTLVHSFPCAVYPPVLDRFVGELEVGGWLFKEYDLDVCGRYYAQYRTVRDSGGDGEGASLLAEADLPMLEQLLTYCQRMDYWTESGWKDVVENGFVVAILRRLQALSERP